MHPNVFRNYCDIESDGSNRVPLSELTGGNAGGPNAYSVRVLRTSQAVTVYAEENVPSQSTPGAVFVDGHNGQGLSVDSNCANGFCDSGRLVADLEVALGCGNATTVNQWPNVDVELSWNSSPDEAPVASNFRVYEDVAAGDQYYVVLAADNYRVRVAYPASGAAGEPISKTVAAACSPGTCEATPITSVLRLRIPELNADSVQLFVRNASGVRIPQFGPFADVTGDVNFCVFNLVSTEVDASFGPVTVERDNINCETLHQTCDAGVFTSLLCPDFGCLADPNGPDSVQFIIFSESQGIIYEATGAPADVLECRWVPAVAQLAVEVIEGTNNCPSSYSCIECSNANTFPQCPSEALACSQDGTCAQCLRAASLLSPACQVVGNVALDALKQCQQRICSTCSSVQNVFIDGCVRHVLPTTSCANVVPATQKRDHTECTTIPGQSFGRILSVFDLFFLPTDVQVALTTPDQTPFRSLFMQGGEPRCYCVLPSLVRVQLLEGDVSRWGSGNEDCVRDVPDAAYDCSVCDFLTILDFDLTGIPRGARATLSAADSAVTDIDQASPFRTIQWVGGIVNHVASLRNAAGTLAPQRTFVTIDDNGATKTLDNVCSDKTCEFEPFTCTLCMDLENPEGVAPGKGVCTAEGQGFLAVELRTAAGTVFRDIPDQGCCNGCAVDTADSKKRSLLHLARTEYRPTCGRYVVLCNAIQYRLTERTVSTAAAPVDCDVDGGICEQLDLIQRLTVDTRCGAGIPGNPTIATEFIDMTLLDSAGQQVRGPRTRFTQNCSIGPEYFNGPTCPNVGNMDLQLGVLAASYQVRVEQLRVDTRRTNYPDLSEHPIVERSVGCSSTDSCTLSANTLFASLVVRSERGLPNSNPGPASAKVKFGQTQQNVMASYSALSVPAQLVAPSPNTFCVLADQRVAYAVQWEAYSSDGPSRPFTDCSASASDPALTNPCRTSGQAILVIPNDNEKK